jgi:hypothetical protein
MNVGRGCERPGRAGMRQPAMDTESQRVRREANSAVRVTRARNSCDERWNVGRAHIPNQDGAAPPPSSPRPQPHASVQLTVKCPRSPPRERFTQITGAFLQWSSARQRAQPSTRTAHVLSSLLSPACPWPCPMLCPWLCPSQTELSPRSMICCSPSMALVRYDTGMGA